MISLKSPNYDPSKLLKYIPISQEEINLRIKIKAADLFEEIYGYFLDKTIKEQHAEDRFRVVKMLTFDKQEVVINCLIRFSWTRVGEWQYKVKQPLHLFSNKIGLDSTYTCIFNATLDTALVIPKALIETAPTISKSVLNRETGEEDLEQFKEIDFKGEHGDILELYTLNSGSKWESVFIEP